MSTPLLPTSSLDPRKALRQQLRNQRRALTPTDRIIGAQRLGEVLLSLPFSPTQGFVAGYWATDGEIALHAWQLGLPKSCIFCLPVLRDDGTLGFAPWRVGDPLAPNRFGIPEPVFEATSLLSPRDMALVILPLVGFDTHGHRLGMGGGWYDRSFAFLNSSSSSFADVKLVGTAFDQQEMQDFTVNDWDVNLDALCTPTRALIFER